MVSLRLLVLAVFATASVGNAADCVVRRAAFDIGSSSIKMKVADVDACAQKILKEVLVDQESVAFREDLVGGGKGQFSAGILEKGEKAVARLKAEAEKADAHAFAGAATEAFRRASNASQFLDGAMKSVNARIVSQDEEGTLGYFAGVSRRGSSSQGLDPAVWDIGSTSMEITTRSPDKKFIRFNGKTASLSFRDRAIAEIEGKDPKRVTSPNPLGKQNAKRLVELAEKTAGEEIRPKLRSALDLSKREVIGIGGTLGAGFSHEFGQQEITRGDLEKALDRDSVKTDSEIGGKFAATQATNAALVLGYMKKLGIQRLHLEPANLTDGILVNPQFYKDH